MTEATHNRCAHVEGGLQCIRVSHPDHPQAHVRISGSYVPDRHRPDEEAVA